MKHLHHPVQFSPRALALTSTKTARGEAKEAAHLIEGRLNVATPTRNVYFTEQGHRSATRDAYNFFDVALLIRPGVKPEDALVQLADLLSLAVEKLEGLVEGSQEAKALWASDGLEGLRWHFEEETIQAHLEKEDARAHRQMELGGAWLEQLTPPPPTIHHKTSTLAAPAPRRRGDLCQEDEELRCGEEGLM